MFTNESFSKIHNKPKATYKAEPDGYGKGKKEPQWKSEQRKQQKRNWNIGDLSGKLRERAN